jgi:hypothetical protein
MTDDCVRDMAVQAKAKGLTIFLNHKYNVPEDVFGVATGAAVTSREQQDGNPIWDLDLDIDLAGTNERVPKTYALIKQDKVKLGVSIGAMIEDWDFKDEDKGFFGGLLIKKVNLLEASIVGIPAQQRSWVQNAVWAIKALARAQEPELVEAEWTSAYINNLPDSAFACIDGGGKKDGDGKTTPRSLRHYPHHDANGKLDQAHLNAALSRVGDSSNAQCGKSHLNGHKGGGKSMEADDTLDQEPLVLDPPISTNAEDEVVDDDHVPEFSPAPGDAEEDDSAAAESEEPPVAAAAEPIETAPVPEQPTVIQNSQDTRLIEATVSTLEAAIGEIATLREANTSLTGQVARLTRERDAATQVAESAAELIERIATTPLGRKTVIREKTSDFRSTVAAIYGPEVAAAMPMEIET